MTGHVNYILLSGGKSPATWRKTSCYLM